MPMLNQRSLKTILWAGLTAATLDGLAAGIILGKMNFTRVFQYVASGALGPGAFLSESNAIYGVLFHYCIATTWAALYYILFPHVALFRKAKIVSGLLYGIFVWLAMNLVVVPLSYVTRGPFTLNGVALNMVILMICIGLPISLITASRHSSARQNA